MVASEGEIVIAAEVRERLGAEVLVNPRPLPGELAFMGQLVPDIYIPDEMTVIEYDGNLHDSAAQQKRDRRKKHRQRWRRL